MLDINDYTQFRQEKDLWCWAAVGVSMVDYYRRQTISQCAFVQKVIGGQGCPDTMASLTKALSAVPCLAGDPIDDPIDPDALRAQVALDFPVCLRLQIDAGLAHVVVVVRCGAGADPLVTVVDPAQTGSVRLPHSELRHGAHRGRWVATYLTRN